MLAGFRSRWTMPLSCAASSASAIWPRDRKRLLHGQRARGDALRERLALDELEHETADAVGLLVAVDRCDGRVIQRSQHPGLALEPRQPLGIRRKHGKHLDRDIAPQLVVAARYTSPIPPAPRSDSTL